jgi:hypothetical protein
LSLSFYDNTTNFFILPNIKITNLYGNDVIIYGKDKCTEYQSTIRHEDRIVGVAGLFNTGTNYLDKLLEYNLQSMEHPHLWQIPWGKHRMAYVKWNHTAPGMKHYNKTNVLPVVVIRDPYSWMQSMCKSPYATVWRHKKHHCPNLIPDPTIDTSDKFPKFNVLSQPTFDVSVIFDGHRDDLTTYHTSLAHLWSEWYKLYLDVDYPILISTYHNMLFLFLPGIVLFFFFTKRVSYILTLDILFLHIPSLPKYKKNSSIRGVSIFLSVFQFKLKVFILTF